MQLTGVANWQVNLEIQPDQYCPQSEYEKR
jgi:hypothetical protein